MTTLSLMVFLRAIQVNFMPLCKSLGLQHRFLVRSMDIPRTVRNYIERGSNKIMRHSAYSARPDRYNPQFIGIANQYGQQKQRRKVSQSVRLQLQSDYIYNHNEDKRLNKTIEAKARELTKLKQAKERHEAALKQKQERNEMQVAQLETLRSETLQRREQARRKREEARQQLRQRNRSQKNKLEAQISTLTQQFESLNESRFCSNKEKYQTARQDKQSAKMKIDAFHRHRNLTALNDYKNRIRAEISLQKKHAKVANRHSEGIKKLSESVALKRNLLESLQEEIDRYRTNYRSCIRSCNRSINRGDDLDDSRMFLSEEELKI